MKINGEGSYESKIWIIGEFPSNQDTSANSPFRGGAGIVLDGLLRKGGLQRRDCYLDNVIQERPESYDLRSYYVDKEQYSPNSTLLDAHARIKGLITTYRPNVVVCLGNEALFAVMGRKGILNWRVGMCLGKKPVFSCRYYKEKTDVEGQGERVSFSEPFG